MYRLSALENEEIKKQVQELLGQGMIRPSTYLCGSPIVLVRKKDSSWNICVDFIALIKITLKNHYLLPHIYNLLDQLKDVIYFTKLDLGSVYHHIRVVEQDIWKTNFNTKHAFWLDKCTNYIYAHLELFI